MDSAQKKPGIPVSFIPFIRYVVHCDVRSTGSTTGFRVLVESQYPLQFVHDAVEEGVELLGEHLQGLHVHPQVNDEASGSFNRNKAALIVAKQERWNGRMRDRY